MAINQVSQGNSIKRLSMTDFTSAANLGGSFAKGCRFVVRINMPRNLTRFGRDLHLMCEAAELPGRGFAISEARYYGPSQVFPTNSQYQPASFSFLCRSDCTERRIFDDWLETINPTNSFNFSYANDYWTDVDVFQYAEYGTGGTSSSPAASRNWQPFVTYHWRLNKAWPTIVNPQQVNWAEQDVLRLQVQFAYKYWDRPTLL